MAIRRPGVECSREKPGGLRGRPRHDSIDSPTEEHLMRKATLTLLALAIVAPFLALAAEPIKMMVPANPGGGWDATGRAVVAALESEGLHKAGAQVTNKGGA